MTSGGTGMGRSLISVGESPIRIASGFIPCMVYINNPVRLRAVSGDFIGHTAIQSCPGIRAVVCL